MKPLQTTKEQKQEDKKETLSTTDIDVIVGEFQQVHLLPLD